MARGTRREGLGRGHLRDSGRVPLSSQKNAKGGGPGTQLATCVAQTSVPGPPTHFPASQEEASSLHPGGPCPESHRRCVLAGVRDEGKVVVGERRWRKLDDARGPLGTAASRGCCGGVRTLRDREDVGSVRTLRDCEDVGSVRTLGDREASEVFIPLGGGCPGIAGWS